MGTSRNPKADLDHRTFLDGAIYLYRRKTSKRGMWDIRLKILGHRGYVIKSSGTADEHTAYKIAHELYLDCLAKQRAGRDLNSRRITSGLAAFAAVNAPLAQTPDAKFVVSMAKMLATFASNMTFDDIDTAYVREMLDYVAANGRKGRASSNTYRRNLTRLKTILKWCVAEGYLRQLPALPQYAEEKRRRPHFTDADWDRVIAVMPDFAQADGVATGRDRTMLINWVMVLYYTGLRMGEARGLRWEDIRAIRDAHDPTVLHVALNVQGKTGKRTTVASSNEVRRYLNAILELRRSDLQNPASDIYLRNDVPAGSLVFCHPTGEPIGSFKKSFLALMKMARVTHSADGMLRTPYSLRHTYATERLNAGVQEYHLAKNMGTSVAMLEQHYGHTSNVANARELTKQARPRSGLVDLDWLAA